MPYGIGAGVGAAGNAFLARSVGHAAKQFFSGSTAIGSKRAPTPPLSSGATDMVDLDDDIIDAEIVEPEDNTM